MTYPPGNPGYQPAQPPGAYGNLNPSFAQSAANTSQLPRYLQIAVVALGLATYLASFGPLMTIPSGGSAGPAGRISLVVPLAVLAALLAAVGLLPKAKNYAPVVAVLTTMATLLAIARVVNHTAGVAIGWALWLVLVLVIVQTIAAVGILLLDAGVVSAPAPRPKYDPYAQYGLPPAGGYYGQHGQHGQHSQPGQPGQPAAHQSRGYQPPQQSGYASYGGYPTGPATGGFGAPSGPSTGGFSAGSQPADPQGPPTPPTGFPSFGSAQSGGSPAAGGQGHGSASSSQGEQPQGGHGSQTSSSDPSGSTPS